MHRRAGVVVLAVPDTPNQRSFGSARLPPGVTCRNRILYRFSTQ